MLKLLKPSQLLKKNFLFFCILLFFSGCTTMYHYEIGQSKAAFFDLNKKNVRKLDLVENTAAKTIYKARGDRPIFFYFQYDVLVQVDRGERVPDIIIHNQ